jgi:hypothetical protein
MLQKERFGGVQTSFLSAIKFIGFARHPFRSFFNRDFSIP